MQRHSGSLAALFRCVWRNRNLTMILIKREVLGRYRGSYLGLLWSFFNPVFMLFVYAFFFGVVFKSRWVGQGESTSEFALVLFVGMIVFNLFSECMNRAPSVVLSNASYVKKVVFPLEILPLVNLGAALFHLGITLVVWLLFSWFVLGEIKSSVILFPFVMLPLLLLTAGVSWVLASLGVYLRDVSQVVGVVTSALMFMSPIFYPISALPVEYHHIMQLNPLAIVVEHAREVLYWGGAPDWQEYGKFLITSFFVAWAGFFWFQRTRAGFADVL